MEGVTRTGFSHCHKLAKQSTIIDRKITSWWLIVRALVTVVFVGRCHLVNEIMVSLQIRDRCKDLVLTDANVKEIMKRFLDDIHKGLGKKSHDKAIVKCFVTYVQDLPNGTGMSR